MVTSATAATLSSTSVSGLGLSGLSSGLDTSGIITKLMAIESGPQTQLKSQLTALQTHTSALQSLNTAVAAIATAASAAKTAGALNSFTASSSSSAVTVTASSSSTAGSFSFTVDRLASAQVTATKAMSSWDTQATPTITITTGVGTAGQKDQTPIQLTSSNLDDVVAAINKQASGVTASKVAAGTDGSGNTLYRIQLRSASGAANAFAISSGSAYDSSNSLGTTTVTQAQDAQVTTAYGDKVTSSTNTFATLSPGTSIAVSATSTSPVTVSVAADSTAAVTSAQSLTTSLITLFSGIASSTAITSSSSTSGGTSSSATSGGVFTGDSLVRGLKDSLLSAVSGSTNGISTSSIGIVLTKDGTITFDQSAFTTAMTTDPAGTLATYQKIASSVSAAATAASDSVSGTITARINSETGQQSSLSSKISDWDTRLAVIQQQYETQFNAMETALNTLSSQASYLTSQISTLTTNYQSSK